MYVSSDGSTVSGVLTAARQQADDSYFYCAVQARVGEDTVGSCFARDRDGDQFACSTSNTVLLDFLRALRADTNVTVRRGLHHGQCEHVSIGQHSGNLPAFY